MSWADALQRYARTTGDVRAKLGKPVCLDFDQHTVTIFDAFEKAKYHFLILPREPFELKNGAQLSGAALESYTNLLRSDTGQASEVLSVLRDRADELVERIREEMQVDEQFTWDVHVGFHAVPSMKHVHLHVISGDLVSERLKNRKHYNSFHPTLGFFLHLDDVIELVEQHGANTLGTLPSRQHFDALLKEPLRSIYTKEEFKTIPKLKEHLASEFSKMRRRRLKETKDKE